MFNNNLIAVPSFSVEQSYSNKPCYSGFKFDLTNKCSIHLFSDCTGVLAVLARDQRIL